MAATFRHGKGLRLLAGSNAGACSMLSGVMNDAGYQAMVETAETTVYGDDDQTFIAGHRGLAATLKGLVDCSTSRTDEARIRDVLGSTADTELCLMPEGRVQTRRAVLLAGIWGKYNVATPAKDAIKWDADFGLGLTQVNIAKDRVGQVLWHSTNRTSTGSSTAWDGSAASAAGYAAQVWVDAGTLTGTATVQVQHSSNGSAWSDLTAFSATSLATMRAARSTSAAVKRYVRATVSAHSSTAARSYDLLVAFARR